MKPKTIKIIYWITTLLFSLLMLMDGMAGLMKVEGGKQGMIHLGYPMYILSIVGMAKVLGVIAIVQAKYQIIKEWGYAGFAMAHVHRGLLPAMEQDC